MMTFQEAIAWALSWKGKTTEAQSASLAEIAELRFQHASFSGRDDKVFKALKKELIHYDLLTRAIPSWQKMADIWSRGERVRLKVSFSGGKSSAYMAKRIKQELSHLFELVFVFANTGREHDLTLVFVDQCDKEYALDVRWVEAVVKHEVREGTGHRVVTFETASRLSHGEHNPNGWSTPFLEVIKKYGIPNKIFQPCNRELKLHTMNSYMKSIGWDDYFTAVGMRSDEDARVKDFSMAFQIFYPLAQLWETDKQDVGDHWEDEPFGLDLPEELGNCVDCHKKLDEKLFKVYSVMPEVIEWNDGIEEQYRWHGAPHHGVPTNKGKPRNRWRGDRSTKQLIAQAHAVGIRKHIPIKDMRSMKARQYSMDFEGDGCGESCEAFPDEMVEAGA